MDWSKAKKILIIAFLIVNIVLLSSNLYRAKGMNQYTATTEEDVKQQLAKVDIKIDTDIPTNVLDIKLLEIKYEDYSTDTKKIDIARKFVHLTDVIDFSNVETEDNTITFNNGNERIDIVNDNKLIYTNNKKENIENTNYDPHEVVNDFLKDKGFDTDDYVLRNEEKNGSVYNLEYTKKYKDTIVEKSYMNFVISSSKVVKFERFWIDAIEEKENKFELRPATDHLLKLLSEEDLMGKDIENIDICYYFDPADTDMFDVKEPRSGDAVPAWNVEFSDGTNKYLYDN
ncbi:two-component system regulatory protein YycI [Clostridium sp. D2Q-14]|uniref:two-component system regulatory protein YycI n=1 Tax=Anaeromonas gelatinilytica TaxID=2683194 RepID=UPI00193BCF90|nr:two-component system regulatory protein YycI [Anaeromonas gelatinilytica]MBS4534432.1 two-component system regulatory protein YycI [Anaeromonas gelatinilytica]